VSDLLSPTAPPQRLRPLFTIGINDITFLEEDLRASKAAASAPAVEDDESREEVGCGWIACTTDGILAMKPALYDVLITMPAPHSQNAAAKVWPKVEFSQGSEMKATQRDLRRYQALQRGLSQQRTRSISPMMGRTNSLQEHSDASDPQASSSTKAQDDPLVETHDADRIVEPTSWSALAYSGFMWWASAGERRLVEEYEVEQDDSLLAGLGTDAQTPRSSQSRSQTLSFLPSQIIKPSSKQELAIIAYFHRLSTSILSTLSSIIDETESDDDREDSRLHPNDDEADNRPAVFVSGDDMARMGLDVWSASDHTFVEDLVQAYFGRRAHVEGRTIDVCGIKIC